jgi:hypothetical protein
MDPRKNKPADPASGPDLRKKVFTPGLGSGHARSFYFKICEIGDILSLNCI